MTSVGVIMLGDSWTRRKCCFRDFFRKLNPNRSHRIQELEEPSGLPEPICRGVYEGWNKKSSRGFAWEGELTGRSPQHATGHRDP